MAARDLSNSHRKWVPPFLNSIDRKFVTPGIELVLYTDEFINGEACCEGYTGRDCDQLIKGKNVTDSVLQIQNTKECLPEFYASTK